VVEEDCCTRRVLPLVEDGHTPAEDIRLEHTAEANGTGEDIRLVRSLEKGKVVVSGIEEGSRSQHHAVERRSHPDLDNRTLQQAKLTEEENRALD